MKLRRLAILALLGALAVWRAGPAGRLAAQITDLAWAEPVNLSQSGTAGSPQLLVEPGGASHVLWQDSIENSFVYVRGEADVWSEPVVVEVPFGTRRFLPELRETEATPLFAPRLVFGPPGQIYAFWLDQEDTLFYSSVAATDLANFAAWSAPQALADGVLAVDAAIGVPGRLHLAYVRSPESDGLPSGLYYQGLNRDTGEWSGPQLLYTSRYYRAVTPDRANVRLASSGDTVYVAWDNRSLDKVFAARSADNGQSWEAPRVVDERQTADAPETAGPANISLMAVGDTIHLFWQAGHEATPCSQFHQWSADRGVTWQPVQALLAEFLSCPELSQVVVGQDGLILLMTHLQGQSLLLAWNGERWSEPRGETILTGFVSSETNRRLAYGWRESAVAGEQLLVVGRNVGDDADTWLLRRPLGTIADWFPAAPVWSAPVQLAASSDRLAAPVAVADALGTVHAFWSEVSAAGGGNAVIQYSHYRDGQWIAAQPIATGLGEDVVGLAAASAGDRLFLVWGGASGALYFSQANASQVRTPGDWSTAQPLPFPATRTSAPDVALDGAGSVYLAYSVPLNESRGVYVSSLPANNAAWSEPALAFDGAAGGWELVGRPRLALTGNGHLHLIWPQATLGQAAGPRSQALYYARSEDGGLTFSDAALLAQEQILSYQITGAGDGTVHVVWQASVEDGTPARHTYSLDGGRGWSAAVSVTMLPGPVAAAGEGGSGLFLLQLRGDTLEQWAWSGDRWVAEEGAALVAPGEAGAGLTAAVSPQGALLAVYAGRLPNLETRESQDVMAATGRTVDAASITITPPPVESLTPEATLAATPDQTAAAATPQATPAGEPTPATAPPPAEDNLARTVLSVVPAGLLILIVLAVGLRSVLRERR